MTANHAVRMASDVLEVEILPELGGRLARLVAFGSDLLLPPPDPEAARDASFFWGAYVMAPWCNRAVPGPVSLFGHRIDLAPNFPDGTAIHGLVSDVPWRVIDKGRLEVEAGGDERWPWRFGVSAAYSLEGPTLLLAYQLQNRSSQPMPAGIGLHPWFRRPVELRVPARRVYPHNANSAPEPEAVAAAHDLRRLGPVEDDLDATWTDLDVPSVDLAWPTLGIVARIELDAPQLHVAVATPTELEAIAVEPQTHAPDGLRRAQNGEPGAVTPLGPGEALDLGVRLTIAR